MGGWGRVGGGGHEGGKSVSVVHMCVMERKDR